MGGARGTRAPLLILRRKKLESQKEEKPAGQATKNSRSRSANVIDS